MPFRQGLTTYLKANVPQVAGRVYPSVLPDKAAAWPSLVYRIIVEQADFDHDGPIHLYRPLVQIDIWGKRLQEIWPAEEAVKAVMLGYRGPMGEVPYTAAWHLENSTDMYEPDSVLHRVSQDWRGWYSSE